MRASGLRTASLAMRVYGRTVPDEFGNRRWVEVDTDAGGFDDAVYVTALAQVLLLQLGESPFFADYGLPAVQSVATQIAPDYFVALTQQRYAPHFASLIITKQPAAYDPRLGRPTPTYAVKILTHAGSRIEFGIPI